MRVTVKLLQQLIREAALETSAISEIAYQIRAVAQRKGGSPFEALDAVAQLARRLVR